MLSGTVLDSPTAELHACLDRLGSLDPSRLDGADQAALLGELTRAGSRIAALRLSVLAAAEKTGAARDAGAASTGQWAARVSRSDGDQAHRQVDLATRLAARPSTREALTDGRIAPGHAEVIVQAVRDLPADVTATQRAQVEAGLLAKAEILGPRALRRAARRALAVIEADTDIVDAHEDALQRDEELEATAHTRLTLHDNADGTITGHFTVPTAHGQILRKILETMTAPRRARPGASVAQAGPTRGPATDWAHERGLAFCELLEHLPTDHLHPRTAATLVVTLDVETLRGSLKASRLDTGETLSSGETRRLACGAGLIPAVLGGGSQVLDLGRHRRLFSDAQRVATGLVFTTCAADGCDRPFAWCELHHRQPWSLGGPTDLAEAVPLCHFHHQRIHDACFVHRLLPDGGIVFSRAA